MKSAAWHIITSEYPPQFGGVSDYTRLVAQGLAAAGDEVHVWCPSLSGTSEAVDQIVPPRANAGEEIDGPSADGGETGGPPANADGSDSGVRVHRELGNFTPADLRRAGSLLDQCSKPRRLLVQWVPHGYGYRSMNLPLCWWLRKRAATRGDRIELMVHEPYLGFSDGSWKQAGVAAMHRVMTAVLMKTASRVWISIPAWEGRLRPYAFGRALEFAWLPIPSNIAVVDDAAAVKAVRDRYAANGEQLVGHFGAYDRNTTELLLDAVPLLLQKSPACKLLLLGQGSEELRAKLLAAQPAQRSVWPPADAGGSDKSQITAPLGLAERVYASGRISASDVSLHLNACDVLLQPFVDGVSSRRGSVMAGLAHGVPIVTTDGRLTEPLWAESEAVALVPCAETPALVKATVELLSDESSRRRLSDAGRELYNERFAIERTVAALRSQRSEVRGQKSEIKSQRSEVRGQRSEVGETAERATE